MSNEIEQVMRITIVRNKTITELEPKSERYITDDGRNGYGNVCVLKGLTLDELMDLRNYINLKLKERIGVEK